MLKLRADDQFNNVVLYSCSSTPAPTGEFEPDAGCPTSPSSPQPVDVKLGQIKPYVLTFPQYLPSRPAARALVAGDTRTTSAEVRDFGRADQHVAHRRADGRRVLLGGEPYVHWNRNLARLAIGHNLGVSDTARLFAMVHTSVSDAIIIGFEAKYHYKFWRPRTSIPRADEDNNPLTTADPSWKPLLTVNHPSIRRDTASGRARCSMRWSPSSRTPRSPGRSRRRRPRCLASTRPSGPSPISTRSKPRSRTPACRRPALRNSIDTGELIGDGIALVVLSQHFGRIE